MAVTGSAPVHEENPDGAGPFAIVCDHASHAMPRGYASLGLPPAALLSHIAWDPGALPVSRRLAEALDAPLVWPDVSRLVIDCNRALDAPDLVPAFGEGRPVPGNRSVDDAERTRRIDCVHAPYHAAIAALLDRRRARGLPTALVAVHSFTPVFHGRPRPWDIGILFDEDRRLAHPLLAALRAEAGLTVGENEPYSPADGVYYTLARHAGSRGWPAVMIEIRNDLIASEAGQREWAARLGAILASLGSGIAADGTGAHDAVA